MTTFDLESFTGPGGHFEITRTTALGRPAFVYKNRPSSLRQVLLDSAAHGERTYAVRGEQRVSFRQHLGASATLARRLVDDYGIVKGDRVAILSSNRVEWLASFWAITSIGAIATGLNTWWNPDEIAYALSDSEPALLIVERNLLANAGPTKVRTLIIEDEFPTVDETELTDASFVLPDVEIGDDDDALILYSSGTTGRPKGVVTTHLAIITNLQNTMLNGLRIMMSRTDPAPEGLTHASLVTVPLFHVSGLHGSAVVGLAAGSKLVFLSGRFDPNEVLRLIETERVTAWGAVPTMIQRIVDHPELDKFDLSSMRNAGMGAAPVPLDLAERTAQAFPNSRQSVANGYGLTETTAVITVGSGDDWLSRPTSVGKPVPTNEVEVRDPATGKALPIGEEGEICIRGAIVMRGYWRKPEATAEAIDEDGFFRTGDLGRIDEDGFIHLTGRLKDLIIRGGENVYPVEIERRLALHPDVDDVAVVGVAHPDLGEEVMAVVQRRAGSTPTAEELAAWVGATLAKFKIPSRWDIGDEILARNAAGKLVKRTIATRVAETGSWHDTGTDR